MSEFSPKAKAQYKLQSYERKPGIDGLEIVELKRFNDDGGAMTELARLDGGAVQGLKGFQALQVNYSTMEPLAIKAFHLHKRQTDVWYVPPADKILLVVADVRAGSKSEGLVQRIVRRRPPALGHGARDPYGLEHQLVGDGQCLGAGTPVVRDQPDRHGRARRGLHPGSLYGNDMSRGRQRNGSAAEAVARRKPRSEDEGTRISSSCCQLT